MQRTLTVAFNLLIAGCSSMPEKPVVEVGAINYPAGEVLAGLSDGSDSVHPVPLSAYDKATCFVPRSWELLKAYVQLLEDFGRRCKATVEAKP